MRWIATPGVVRARSSPVRDSTAAFAQPAAGWNSEGVSMKTMAVLTTTDSLDEARAIATALVDRKLAACAQISSIESIYTWQGATQKAQEYRLLAKTASGRYADVEAAIRELHSYELPAIYALDMARSYGPFAEWVIENSTAEGG